MTSLWLDHHAAAATDAFGADQAYDTIVVGGGHRTRPGCRHSGARRPLRRDDGSGLGVRRPRGAGDGMPVLGKGAYFARLRPLRSYACAFSVPGPIPQGMYLSLDDPTRSLRTAPAEDQERLIIGGNGHIVGHDPSPRALLHDLERWTLGRFPGAELTHTWSAQDYQSLDYAPLRRPDHARARENPRRHGLQ